MTPLAWLQIGGGAALLIGSALAGWTIRDWKADSDTLEAQEAAQERYDALAQNLADKSLAYEELAQGIRANERTDRTTIQEIYREVKVPGDCAVPDGVSSVLDNAVREANAATTGKPSGPMPEATEAANPVD